MSIRLEADQVQALERLRRRLGEIDRLEAHERPRTRDPFSTGSALARDDAKARPFRLSHTVGHALALSLDAMVGSRLLLRDQAPPYGLRLLMAAPYSTLRTSIEAGALAAWILLPDDGDERVRRSLRSTWTDIQNDSRLRRAYAASDATDYREAVRRKHQLHRENHAKVAAEKAMFHAVASAAGLGARQEDRRLPGFEELVAQTAVVTGVASSTAAGLWRTLSGLTHPSASRTLSASLVETTDSMDPDVLHATFIARPDLLDASTAAALRLHAYVLARVAELGDNSGLRFEFESVTP